MSKEKCRRWEEVLPPGIRIQVLCIGVNEYTAREKLENAVADAESVAKKFEGLGALNSRVRRCKNPTTRAFLWTEVEEFLRNIDKQSPPEIVVIFFAGHAIQEGDKIYMFPATADPKHKSELDKQCLSHDVLFEILKKRLDDKIDVIDVRYIVILDACRNSLESMEAIKTPFSDTIHEPLPARPEHWVLCTSTSRQSYADDGEDGHSPFTRQILSSECGLFETNVPLRHALELVCKRLSAQGEQKPCVMPVHNIPESLCLCNREQHRAAEEQADVFLCFRDGGVDRALAQRLSDKLKTFQVEHGSEKRPVKVFLEAKAAYKPTDQVAKALHSSTMILLVVSHGTFDGVEELKGDSKADDRLVQMLWQYEMLLELLDSGRRIGQNLGLLLVGNKREKLGRSEFEMFDEGDTHEREKFWPISKVPDVIVTSVVEHALAGLRYDIDAAKLLDYKLLKDFKLPSIIGGRTTRQTISAFSDSTKFRPWRLEGPEDDALDKICRRVKEILDSDQLAEKQAAGSAGISLAPSPAPRACPPEQEMKLDTTTQRGGDAAQPNSSLSGPFGGHLRGPTGVAGPQGAASCPPQFASNLGQQATESLSRQSHSTAQVQPQQASGSSRKPAQTQAAAAEMEEDVFAPEPHRTLRRESAAVIGAPGHAPAVVAQEYFVHVMQALEELPWTAHLLHYFFETQKELLKQQSDFTSVENYINFITKPRAHPIAVSAVIAASIFENIQKLLPNKVQGVSGLEQINDVKDLINFVVKSQLSRTKDIDKFQWDQTFMMIRTCNTEEVIKWTEDFFNDKFSSCVLPVPALARVKSFGIFFRLPSWLARLVLFILKHNPAVQYRLMNLGYRSFAQLRGGVTPEDPGMESSGKEQVHYSIICGYNIGDCPEWVGDSISFEGHIITQEHRDIVERLSREYHQRFEAYQKEVEEGWCEEEKEVLVVEEVEEEFSPRHAGAMPPMLPLGQKRLDSEAVGAAVEGAVAALKEREFVTMHSALTTCRQSERETRDLLDKAVGTLHPAAAADAHLGKRSASSHHAAGEGSSSGAKRHSSGMPGASGGSKRARSMAGDDVVPKEHAEQRMGERAITEDDIRRAKRQGKISLSIHLNGEEDTNEAIDEISRWGDRLMEAFERLEVGEVMEKGTEHRRVEVELLGSENTGPEIQEWLKEHNYFSENERQHRVLFTLEQGKEEVVVVEGRTDGCDDVGVITVYRRGTGDIGLVVLCKADFADQVVSIVPPPSGKTVRFPMDAKYCCRDGDHIFRERYQRGENTVDALVKVPLLLLKRWADGEETEDSVIDNVLPTDGSNDSLRKRLDKVKTNPFPWKLNEEFKTYFRRNIKRCSSEALGDDEPNYLLSIVERPAPKHGYPHMTLECLFCYGRGSAGTQRSDRIHDARLNGLRKTGILLPYRIFENVTIDSQHTDYEDKREAHLLQVCLPHGSSAHYDKFPECSEYFFVEDGLKLESKDWAGQPFVRINQD